MIELRSLTDELRNLVIEVFLLADIVMLQIYGFKDCELRYRLLAIVELFCF